MTRPTKIALSVAVLCFVVVAYWSAVRVQDQLRVEKWERFVVAVEEVCGHLKDGEVNAYFLCRSELWMFYYPPEGEVVYGH